MQADRTIERRMAELAGRAAHTGIAQIAWFLSPAQREQAEICARQANVSLFDEGGTPNAERRVVAFADSDWTPDWPIRCLRILWHARYGAPGHRDLLGSLLGLGIGREKIGDIFPGEGEAYAFVLADMADYIAASLDRVGGTPVRIEVLDAWPAPDAADGTPIRATVPSLRLDALLGAALRLSRARAADLISAGRVQVNHQLEMRADRHLEEGAVLSIRGMGRVRVESIGSITKKGRIGVVLLRY